MDNQKDFYIKDKLQKDELISKKADDIFNNFLKGEVEMEEKEKVVNIEKSKSKFNKKKILAVAASLIVVFMAVNGYAATKGYNNVFFMIRNLVTKETQYADKEEILMDRDITISYSNIHLSNDLSIQINKLQIKDDEAKLLLSVTEHTGKDYISKIIVRDTKNNKVLSDEMFANKNVSNGEEVTYQETVTLKGFSQSTNEISIEIFDKNQSSISTLLIDLDKREIDIMSDSYEANPMERLSETELKEEFAKLLEVVPDYSTLEEAERAFKFSKLSVAMKYVLASGDECKTENVLKAYNEIFGEDKTDPESLLVKGEDFITIKNGKFEFAPHDNTESILIIEVKHLMYANGVYTAQFVYSMPSDEDYINNRIEDLPLYFTSVEFKINKDYEYSKYQLLNVDYYAHNEYIEETIDDTIPTYSNTTNTVSNTISNNYTNTYRNNTVTNDVTIVNNNQTNIVTNTTNNNSTSNNYDKSKIDNYASTMSWTDYWSPGLRLSYPTIFSLTEVGGYYRGSSQGSLATTISGLAVGIDRETDTIIESNLTMEIYEPVIIDAISDEMVADYILLTTGNAPTGAGFSTFDDDFWAYVPGTNDTVQEYYHYEPLSDGNSVVYRIRFICDRWDNYKVTNILNRVMGSLTPTSY